MKFLIPFLLLALVPVVIGQQCNRNVNYDHYRLTMTWPVTFCSLAKNRCDDKFKKVTNFVVHGLW